MSKYLKFIAQVAATVAVALVAAFSDNTLDTSEVFNAIIVALGSIAVLGAGNFPAGVWAYMKSYVSAAAAAAVFLASAYTGGISPAEWLQLGLAVLGTVGVYGLPGPLVKSAQPVGYAAPRTVTE